MRSEINNFYYHLAQAGVVIVVFVAFRHIQCCGWPHQNGTMAHRPRALTIHYFSMMLVFGSTMPVFVNTTINRVPINDTDAQNLSLNIVPGFIREETALGRRKVLRKDST
jgi:hypothetical protein